MSWPSIVRFKTSGWRPIETAPKDAPLLILYDGDAVACGWFMDGQWFEPGFHRLYPTHWMPLPEPPK